MPLPPELIDHIFSFLLKDTLALKACSKAHPLFSRLAERHLYSHIVVDPQAPEICNHLLENSRYLDYPRNLEIGGHLYFIPNQLAMPIMPIIPRMANLISLSIHNPFLPSREEVLFFSALRNCLQQSSFQQLSLSYLNCFRFSILDDDAKNIKQLKLSYCTVDDDEAISSSPSQVSLETLILCGEFNSSVHLWATRWVSRLTTLEVRDSLNHDWTGFPELLATCSNSLSKLYLDASGDFYTTHELPFTLSALSRLEKLSMSALIIRGGWTLPEIIRVINSAPAIRDVALRFHCLVSDSITSIARFDWSLLDLQSNSTGKRPLIDLCVTSVFVADKVINDQFSSESILNALSENEALMDLVKRGLVIPTSQISFAAVDITGSSS